MHNIIRTRRQELSSGAPLQSDILSLMIRSAEEELEAKLGFDLFSEGEKRLGWLLTFASVSEFCASEPKMLIFFLFNYGDGVFFLFCGTFGQ